MNKRQAKKIRDKVTKHYPLYKVTEAHALLYPKTFETIAKKVLKID